MSALLRVTLSWRILLLRNHHHLWFFCSLHCLESWWWLCRTQELDSSCLPWWHLSQNITAPTFLKGCFTSMCGYLMAYSWEKTQAGSKGRYFETYHVKQERKEDTLNIFCFIRAICVVHSQKVNVRSRFQQRIPWPVTHWHDDIQGSLSGDIVSQWLTDRMTFCDAQQAAVRPH